MLYIVEAYLTSLLRRRELFIRRIAFNIVAIEDAVLARVAYIVGRQVSLATVVRTARRITASTRGNATRARGDNVGYHNRHGKEIVKGQKGDNEERMT